MSSPIIRFEIVLSEDDSMSLVSGSYLDADDIADLGSDRGANKLSTNPVGKDFIEKMCFLKLKDCQTCLHTSSDMNLLRRGPYCNCRDQPTWPWLHGTPICPKGFNCRICDWMLPLSGLLAQFKSKGAVVLACKETKKHPTLQDIAH